MVVDMLQPCSISSCPPSAIQMTAQSQKARSACVDPILGIKLRRGCRAHKPTFSELTNSHVYNVKDCQYMA